MKIQEAIAYTGERIPSAITDDQAVRSLLSLDVRIYNELMTGLTDCPETAPSGYTKDDLSQELLVAHPYDEMYVHYLCAQIHHKNAEYERYTNEMAAFNSLYSAYAAKYARDHGTAETPGMTYYATDDDELADWGF